MSTKIHINNFLNNKNNKQYTEIDVQPLVESILKEGLQRELIVTNPNEKGKVRIIDGMRRLHAIRIIRDKHKKEYIRLFPNGMIPCETKVLDENGMDTSSSDILMYE